MATKREILKISIPNKPEYVPLVRMLVSCLATKLDARVDIVEEMKLALSEACNRMIEETRNKTINISFEIKGNSIICQFDNYRNLRMKQSKINNYEKSISETFMNAFMDKVKFGKNLIMEKTID